MHVASGITNSSCLEQQPYGRRKANKSACSQVASTCGRFVAKVIMVRQLSLVVTALYALLHITCALRIASSLQWIEHTPQPYAIKNFYKGSSAATLTSGGVANLGSDPKNFDLAANAETQGLSEYRPNEPVKNPLTSVSH